MSVKNAAGKSPSLYEVEIETKGTGWSPNRRECLFSRESTAKAFAMAVVAQAKATMNCTSAVVRVRPYWRTDDGRFENTANEILFSTSFRR